MRILFVMILSLMISTVSAQLAPVSIQSNKLLAGYPSHFYLTPFDPNIIVDTNGYSPDIPAEILKGANGLYVREDVTQVIWNFGDDSPEVNTSERVGAAYVYKNPGNYTVSVKLVDSTGKIIKSASLDITVEARAPRVAYVAVPSSTEEPTRLIFTAATFDRDMYDAEVLTYNWDFGDGSTRAGEGLKEVAHTYATSGTYKTKLTVKSNYDLTNERNKKVTVLAANRGAVTQTAETLERPDVISNDVNLRLTGSASGELKASARRMVNLTYLAPAKNGDCRLWVHFWDDAQLAHGSILLNLGVLPGNTSNFVFRGKNRFDLSLFANAKDYLDKKSTFLAGGTPSGLGGAMHPYGRAAVFRMNSGEIKFTLKNGEYLVGNINAGLKGHLRPKQDDDKDLLIGASGDISLDLRSQGFAMAAMEKGFQCIENPFSVTRRYPENGERHVQQTRPVIRLGFSDALELDSISNNSFQIGYPNNDGEFVTVAGQFINDKKRIQFVPTQALRKGVRYTVRLKVGEQGVRSAAGNFIRDSDGSGWQTSEFWTQLPFSNEAESPSNLSCDVYQSVKNVPLILGKPALMKIYAEWPKHADVHADAQYKKFDAVIKLSDAVDQPLGSQVHSFIRPDLRQNWSKARLRKQEAAQYPFVPLAKNRHILVSLDAKKNNSRSDISQYFFECATPAWDLSPELTVDVFALNFGRYGFDDKSDEHTQLTQSQTAQVVKRLVKDAKTYAEQVFPVKGFVFSEPNFIDVPRPSDLSSGCDFECWVTDLSKYFGDINYCDPGALDMALGAVSTYATHWRSVVNSLRQRSSADLVVLFGPHEIFGGGGAMVKKLSDGQGLVYMTAGNRTANFDRYVFGLVHEIGHALELDHTPVVDACSRGEMMAARDAQKTQAYSGIDGIRLSEDGTNWWHKSSRLGNDQSRHIMPLMYPGTVSPDAAFILRDQYRSIQVLLEDLKE